MSEGRMTLRDGRTLAWREYGPPDGRPILRFQGTPGSRNSRHPDEGAYDRLHVRVIVFDRPGYGASSRLTGRGISVVADDAAELLGSTEAALIVVGDPTLEEGIDKAVTRADRKVRRDLDVAAEIF